MANDSSNKTIYAAMGANLAIAITKFIAVSIIEAKSLATARKTPQISQ